jgi:hypothetical protein
MKSRIKNRKGVFALENEARDFVLGMAYVPPQEWRDIYDVDYAFTRGTIFAELDKPWFGGDCDEK